MTRVTAAFSDERVHESKAFRDFQVGDVLYALKTDGIGIKVGPNSIRFLTWPGGMPRTSPGNISDSITPSKLYGVPASVTITVTR